MLLIGWRREQVYEVLYEGRQRPCGLMGRWTDYFVLFVGKDVKERAETLMNFPVMTELELPEKNPNGPARKLMQKLGLGEDDAGK